jgi:UDP-3-O-[3-hydroxymyristoyl] glucosamine N-acyltransferase
MLLFTRHCNRSDGFGQAKSEDGTYIKIPQKGIVVIEDDVEMEATAQLTGQRFEKQKSAKALSR